MHRPDKVGGLYIIFASFTLYLAVANLLTFLGLPLPLGSVGNEIVLLAVVFTNVSIVLINSKRRQKQQTNPAKSV